MTGSIERPVDKRPRHYLRDVRDDLILVDEEVAAQRNLLGAILEANTAVISAEQTKISVQQNSPVEQLTILATVFLPLTFVTGFFGQNFSWPVGHIVDGAASSPVGWADCCCRWRCCSCGSGCAHLHARTANVPDRS